MIRRYGMLLGVIVLVGLLSIAGAQDAGQLSYGMTAVGGVTAESPGLEYTFTGVAGETFQAVVVGLAPEMSPKITLLTADRQQLALTRSNPFVASNSAELIYRIKTDGTYILRAETLTGSTGSLALSLVKARDVALAQLEPGTPLNVAFDTFGKPQVLTFKQAMASESLISISTESPNFAFTAVLREAAGLEVAQLGYTVRDGQLQLPSGAETAYDLVIVPVDPQMTGSVQVTLSQADAPVRSDDAGDVAQDVAAPTTIPVPQATSTLLPTAAPSVEPVQDCVNEAEFVADVTIPDLTIIQPGVPFVKIWRLRNIGTCTWSASYRLAKVSGDALTIQNDVSAVSLPVTAPGQTVDISLTMVLAVETRLGRTERAVFELQTPAGEPFGPQPFVEIIAGQQ